MFILFVKAIFIFQQYQSIVLKKKTQKTASEVSWTYLADRPKENVFTDDRSKEIFVFLLFCFLIVCKICFVDITIPISLQLH